MTTLVTSGDILLVRSEWRTGSEGSEDATVLETRHYGRGVSANILMSRTRADTSGWEAAGYHRPDEKPPGGTRTRFGASTLGSVGVTALGLADFSTASTGLASTGLASTGDGWASTGEGWTGAFAWPFWFGVVAPLVGLAGSSPWPGIWSETFKTKYINKIQM